MSRYICFLFSGYGMAVPRQWLKSKGLVPYIAVDLNKDALDFWKRLGCKTLHANVYDDMYIPGEEYSEHLTLSWDGKEGAHYVAHRRGKMKFTLSKTYFWPVEKVIPRGSVVIASPPCTCTCAHAHNLFHNSEKKEWMRLLLDFLQHLLKLEKRQCIVVVELNIRKKYVIEVEKLGYVVVKNDAGTIGSPSSRTRYWAMAPETHHQLQTPKLTTGWGITKWKEPWYTNNATFPTDYLRRSNEPAQTIGKKGLYLYNDKTGEQKRAPPMMLAQLLGVYGTEYKLLASGLEDGTYTATKMRFGLGMGFSSFHMIWVVCACLNRLGVRVDARTELRRLKNRIKGLRRDFHSEE